MPISAVSDRCCCRGARKCNGIVLALCCASCFFCSLFDACCSVCRKNIQCGPTTICRRPSSVIVGLFIRIFVREAIAAAGPLLVVMHEEEVASSVDTVLDKSIVVILAIIVASLVAYLVGALIGVWIEALFGLCAGCCCVRSTSAYVSDDVENAESHALRTSEVVVEVEADKPSD